MAVHPLISLAERFPQLALPVEPGMRETELYKNAVLRGCPVETAPQFSFSGQDALYTEPTPAGEAEILFISEREDFEHVIRALAYRCEPHEIPPSMGATTLSGLIDWGKLRPHTSSDEEYREFISVKSNYLSTLIILSNGNYSAVPAEKAGMDEDAWRSASVTIRKFHELTHFTSIRLWPENKNAIRDEIVADLIGIFAAFGEYRDDLARLFLGTEGETYRSGGRLQNYAGGRAPDELMPEVNSLIALLKKETAHFSGGNVFDILTYIESNGIGIIR